MGCCSVHFVLCSAAWCRTMLYCSALCCAVLCCAVLCCAVLCCAVLHVMNNNRNLGWCELQRQANKLHEMQYALASFNSHHSSCQLGSGEHEQSRRSRFFCSFLPLVLATGSLSPLYPPLLLFHLFFLLSATPPPPSPASCSSSLPVLLPHMFAIMQAKLVARALSGRAILPSQNQMLQDIAAFYQLLIDNGVPVRYTHNQVTLEQCRLCMQLSLTPVSNAVDHWLVHAQRC